MFSAIPLDEKVVLNVTYEINNGVRTTFTRSPLSRELPLRQAVREAMILIGTGARVTIVARGTTYGDEPEFRAIWSRRDFEHRSNRND